MIRAAVVSALVVGCAVPTVAPRETARASVLAVAEAVRVADDSCATVALAKALDDKEAGRALAQRCALAYDVAKPALIAAASGVDAWDAGARSAVVCSVHDAGEALVQIAGAITAAGGHVPPAVEDGIKLLGLLGGCEK